MINSNIFSIIFKLRAPDANEGDNGGKDAQSIKNARDFNLDSKTTINSFRIIKDSSLGF